MRVLAEALQRHGEDPQQLLSACGLDDESLAQEWLLEAEAADAAELPPSTARSLAPGGHCCSSGDLWRMPLLLAHTASVWFRPF